MRLTLVQQRLINHNRLRKKGVTMQAERILRAAILVGRLRDSSNRSHALRIKTAQLLSSLIDQFIATEVERATTISKSDPAHLTWTEIGQCLNLSRSAAYTRYGGQKSEH